MNNPHNVPRTNCELISNASEISDSDKSQLSIYPSGGAKTWRTKRRDTGAELDGALSVIARTKRVRTGVLYGPVTEMALRN